MTESVDITIDTRPIFARQETPCAAIDQALADLQPDQQLVLLLPFEPVPLYTKLAAHGFSHRSSQLEDGTWRVEFRRTGQGEAPIPSLGGCGCHSHP